MDDPDWPEPAPLPPAVVEAGRVLLDRVADLARLRASAYAEQLQAVAALAVLLAPEAPAAAGSPDELPAVPGDAPSRGTHAAAAELAARLRMPLGSAYTLVSQALALTTRLPVTFAALSEGAVDETRARAVVDETELLSDAGAAVVEEKVAPVMGDLTTGELRLRLKAEVADIDRDAVKRRARKATADRLVRIRSLGSGIGELSMVGPFVTLQEIYTVCDAMAHERTRPGARVDPHASFVHGGAVPVDRDGNPVDRRGIDARRFDAVHEKMTQPLASAPGLGSGAGPQIFVTLAAAVGLDDTPARLGEADTIPAEMAQALLEDHRFRRVLTDPVTGTLVHVDGHSYPPGTLPSLGRARPDGGSVAAQVTRPPDPPAAPPDLPAAPPSDPPAAPPPEPSAAPSPEPPAAPSPADRAAVAPPCPVAAAGGGEYQVPAAVQRFVRARQRRCSAPGCRVPARRCDLDHREAWPSGPTCPCNLAPLCRRHHLAKHRFGWLLTKASPDPRDPSQHWQSPLGYHYTVAADPVLPPLTGSDGGAAARPPEQPAPPLPPLPPLPPVSYPQVDRGSRSRHRADGDVDGGAAACPPPPRYPDGDPPF